MFKRLLALLFPRATFLLSRATAFLFACVTVLVFLPATASATTAITGNVKNLGTGAVSAGSFVRFYLRGCSGNQPRVNGSAIIAPTLGNVYYFDFVPSSSGAISGTLYSTRDSTGVGPGDIECGGSLTAVWYGMQPYLNGKAGPETPIHANSGATLDVSTVIPITAMPVVTAAVGLTQLTLPGSISGFTTIRAEPVASGVLTVPAATDTLVGQSTTDTLFNKTIFAGQLSGTTINNTMLSSSLGSVTNPIYSFAQNPNTGFYSPSLNQITAAVGGVNGPTFSQNGITFGADGQFINFGLARDTSLSRVSAGVVAVGNGNQGDASGTLNLASVSSPGTDLGLATTGDQFSTVRAHVRNRTGANGFVVENPGQSLADFAGQVTAAITNIAIDSANNLTVTAAFASAGSTLPAVGQTVTLTGLTNATFLNGQSVTIATISATQFTASFAHAAYASAADIGTAAAQINVRAELRNDQIIPANTSGEIQILDPTAPTTHWLAVGKAVIRPASGIQLQAGNGTTGANDAPAYSFATATNQGMMSAGGNLQLVQGGFGILALDPSGLRARINSVYGWSASGGDPFNAANDTGLSRTAAGMVALGNGNQGDASGTLNLQNFTSPALGTANSTPTNFGSGNVTFGGSAWNGSSAVSVPATLSYAPAQVTNPNLFLALNFPSTMPFGSFFQLQNLKPATSVANVNSPVLQLIGQSWSGSASQQDTWMIQNLLGSGANPSNTLTFSRFGGTGAGAIQMPTLSFPLQTAPPNPPTGSITIYGDTTSGQITCRNATGTSCFTATAAAPFVSSTANPAQTGVLRAATTDTAVAFRNNGNTADVPGLAKNSSDVVVVGGSAGISASGYQVNGSALSASNLSNGTTGSGAVVLQNSPTINSPTITGTPSGIPFIVCSNVSPVTDTTQNSTINLQSCTIPANALTAGNVMDIDVSGIVTTSSGNNNNTVTTSLGGQSICSADSTTTGTVTNRVWHYRVIVFVLSSGSSGTASATCVADGFFAPGTGPTTTFSVNTTSSLTLQVAALEIDSGSSITDQGLKVVIF